MIKVSIVIPVYNQEELVLRALDSIPKRKDLELIIIDDQSTDASWDSVELWAEVHEKDFGDIITKQNEENEGVGASKCWAYSVASGEYIHTIDSDDYVYTEEYNKAIDRLYEDGLADILVLDYKENNGDVCVSLVCNATWRYFIKLSYLKEHALSINPNHRRAEDWYLMRKVEQFNPTIERLGLVAYHYNYPRENSIMWNWERYGVDWYEHMYRNN